MKPFRIIEGDALAVLNQLPSASFSSCVTDPPYGLRFMGKDWDHGIPAVPYWREVHRVLKPGAFLLAFGGTRTFHRLTVAIEDAGFEIRDCLCWLYGSGFPKSLDISKAIDKAAGAEREIVGRSRRHVSGKPDQRTAGLVGTKTFAESIGMGSHETAPHTDAARLWSGYGTALKPAWEPIIVAMKPLDGTFAANALAHGVAGLNVDGGRIEGSRPDTTRGAGGQHGITSPRGPQGRIEDDGSGRWPANVALDEDAAAMLDEQSGELVSGANPERRGGLEYHGAEGQEECEAPRGIDIGGASRFFYCAKADRAEREAGLDHFEARRSEYRPNDDAEENTLRERLHGSRAVKNHHPTVKPAALMAWLCTLTKPPTGGHVLDPFAGSGTTGIAALRTGQEFTGIELNPDYCDMARARIEGDAPLLNVVDEPAAEADVDEDQIPLFEEGKP